MSKEEIDRLIVELSNQLKDFEQVARKCKAKYVLGLSATVTRKDGHHPIIFMQCGAVRFRIGAKQGTEAHPFQHREIELSSSLGYNPERYSLQ